MTKRKADYPQTEVELTPEIRELLENFTEEEIETGVVAGGFAPAEPGSGEMEPALFEDLMESVREAGAMLRAKGRSGATDVIEAVTQVMASSGHLSSRGVVDRVFQELTGVDADTLLDWVLGRAEMPRVVGARRLRNHLAELLGCRPAEASTLLGVSDSRVRSNDVLSGEMLDRAYAVLEIYVRVASAVRPLYAAAWFSEPHPSLGGQVPWRLLRTSFGCGVVVDLVDAALAGSYV